MNDSFKPSIGAVMSADIAVPQHDKMVQFYTQVLTTGAHPLWQEKDLLNNLGIPIIGLGAQSPEYAELPLQWMPHFQVADIGDSVTQALDLGGCELMHGKDDEGASQWAVIEDPNGATFGLIPVVTDEMVHSYGYDKAAESTEKVGCIAWLDLTVVKATETRDFYQAVIGWSAEDVSMNDDNNSYHDYNMLRADGLPAAGVCHAKGVNANVPPVWLLYLPVDDLSASLKHVEPAGGQIVNQSKNNNNQITQALIQDPVGTYIVLVQV